MYGYAGEMFCLRFLPARAMYLMKKMPARKNLKFYACRQVTIYSNGEKLQLTLATISHRKPRPVLNAGPGLTIRRLIRQIPSTGLLFVSATINI
jgi:hypothetical protein